MEKSENTPEIEFCLSASNNMKEKIRLSYFFDVIGIWNK